MTERHGRHLEQLRDLLTPALALADSHGEMLVAVRVAAALDEILARLATEPAH
jgi:hypothetical protein